MISVPLMPLCLFVLTNIFVGSKSAKNSLRFQIYKIKYINVRELTLPAKRCSIIITVVACNIHNVTDKY